MQPYTYKDSGIEWQGSVPTHWKRGKLFRLCDEMGSGGTPRSSNEAFYDGDIPWIQSGDLNDAYVSITKKTISESALANSSAKMFPKGTLLIAMYGATIGKLGMMEMDAATNQACCALRLSRKLNSKFVFYMMWDMRNFLIGQSYGGTQPNISQETLKQRYLHYPPISEQKAIAEYLEKACASIDRILAIKEEQLRKIEGYFTNKLTQLVTVGLDETNNTKETTCFWMPKVKSDWKVIPLKRALAEKLRYGANESAEDENRDDPRYIRITDFDNSGKLKDSTFKSLPPEIAKPYLIQNDDVLFARSGATVGKTFIFKDYDGEACFAGYLIKANTLRYKLLPQYLYFFTKSKAYEEWKNLIFTQATIQNIGADKYQYLPITLPSLNEQIEIVSVINDLKSKVDSLSSNIQNQIDTLKAYRKSLIHECVTGKKQVAEMVQKEDKTLHG